MILTNNLKFPDGTGFYPDTKDGVRGYNTDAARGADTFRPFSSIHKDTKIDLLYCVEYYGSTTRNVPISANYDMVIAIVIANNPHASGGIGTTTLTYTSQGSLIYHKEGQLNPSEPNTRGSSLAGILILKDVKSGDKITLFGSADMAGAVYGFKN